MIGFCPNCKKDTELRMIKTDEQIEIRGELIPAQFEYYQCEECGQDFEIPRTNYDPLDAAYREYRRRKGMLQPEEIKDFRMKLGLTQKELSEIASIGIATLNRYENGALQSEAQDRLIQSLMQPENLLKFLTSRPDVLSGDVRQRIFINLQGNDESCGDLLSKTITVFGNYPSTIMSGYKRFDPDKFFETIKLLCYPERVFKTKLNKLLFYVDFKYFKEHTISITGARYAHATYGPVPHKYDTWLSVLTEWCHEISVNEEPAGDYSGEVFLSKKPDLGLFEPSEIECISLVKAMFRPFNAKEITEHSHQEKGFLETKDGELISYEYASHLSV